MTTTTEQLKDLLAKVTPGEWRVEQDTTLVWGACNTDDTSSSGMGYPIAEARITPISISSWARGPGEGAGDANATLIALAPSLAAEVVRLRDAIDAALSYLQFEINPSNYDHDDACRLNDNACNAYGVLACSVCMDDDGDAA